MNSTDILEVESIFHKYIEDVAEDPYAVRDAEDLLDRTLVSLKGWDSVIDRLNYKLAESTDHVSDSGYTRGLIDALKIISSCLSPL